MRPLYVLDHCWIQQPEPNPYFHLLDKEERNHDLRGLGLFGIAAALDQRDRIDWVLDTGRLSLDSPHLQTATVKAAQEDSLDVFRELISREVDVSAEFTVDGFRIAREEEAGEQRTLIDIAVENLSGKVACFL